MYSSKFVQMIETHSEQIAGRVLRQLRADRRAPHIAGLPETELTGHCQEILRNLGHWLVASPEEEIARRYGEMGRLRWREEVPLHEAVHALQLLKAKMLDYIREQGVTQTTVDLYAEEELERQVGRFFDSAVYHLVRGYEGSLRQAAGAGA